MQLQLCGCEYLSLSPKFLKYVAAAATKHQVNPVKLLLIKIIYGKFWTLLPLKAEPLEASGTANCKKTSLSNNHVIAICIISGRKGALVCKLHWYPKFYNHDNLFID